MNAMNTTKPSAMISDKLVISVSVQWYALFWWGSAGEGVVAHFAGKVSLTCGIKTISKQHVSKVGAVAHVAHVARRQGIAQPQSTVRSMELLLNGRDPRKETLAVYCLRHAMLNLKVLTLFWMVLMSGFVDKM